MGTDQVTVRAPPGFLFVTHNKDCNLRCQHCYYWRQGMPAQRVLTPAEIGDVIAEFADMNPRGFVVICGGESMLDLDGYFYLCSLCRTIGMRCLSVINGTKVDSIEMARRMIAEGPHEITVSLDSADKEVHDRLRGMQGAFEMAVNALRLLVRARLEARGSTRIHAMILLCKVNYLNLDTAYELVLSHIGADKLKVNAIQPSFIGNNPYCSNDLFFAQNSQVDVERLMEILHAADVKYGLGLNAVWLHQIEEYFRVLKGAGDLWRGWGTSVRTAEHLCNSAERNIMVSQDGSMGLCFSVGFPRRQFAVHGDLKKFWHESDGVRNQMSTCNALCGISHSVRREPATRRNGCPK